MNSLLLLLLFGGVIVLMWLHSRRGGFPEEFKTEQISWAYIATYIALQVLVFFRNPVLQIKRKKGKFKVTGYRGGFSLLIRECDSISISGERIVVSSLNINHNIEKLRIDDSVEDIKERINMEFPEIAIK